MENEPAGARYGLLQKGCILKEIPEFRFLIVPLNLPPFNNNKKQQ